MPPACGIWNQAPPIQGKIRPVCGIWNQAPPHIGQDPPCMWDRRPSNPTSLAKRFPSWRGAAWKLGEEMPIQVSSSSSDRGSKLRGLSPNSPRVASKLDIDIAKLN
ncbi:hypothetical protein AVEN_17802-1 [Araneus ventricosus]|uniref:Uncharacterized protein n=1 Tax=Araneus ventricosus TaxID=182803 RepID=A0A4Y2QK36_ARAVE|nr:hypothetical protein AVEN_17802-1 [Araneus ventricosus]